MTDTENKYANKKVIIIDRSWKQDPPREEFVAMKLPSVLQNETRPLRVAVYARSAVPYSGQVSSFEHQMDMFKKQIQSQPNWSFSGIYKDECIGDKSPMSRKAMNEMLEDCKAGKIDLIMTSSVARFSTKYSDFMPVIKMLGELDPPVGIWFTSENVYTLDSYGQTLLIMMFAVAEEEFRRKSNRCGVITEKDIRESILYNDLIPPEVKAALNHKTAVADDLSEGEITDEKKDTE